MVPIRKGKSSYNLMINSPAEKSSAKEAKERAKREPEEVEKEAAKVIVNAKDDFLDDCTESKHKEVLLHISQDEGMAKPEVTKLNDLRALSRICGDEALSYARAAIWKSRAQRLLAILKKDKDAPPFMKPVDEKGDGARATML
jgi:hypothetical protein